MSQSRFTKREFLSGGSWTAPAGVTQVIVYGMGGGSGGTGGSTTAGNFGGESGGGSSLQATILTVVPNTTYTITIGAGGAGGTAPTGKSSKGGDTSFGALMTWVGAPAATWRNGFPWNFGIYRFRTIVTATNMAAYSCGGENQVGGNNFVSYPTSDGRSTTNGTNSALRSGGAGGGNGEEVGGAGGNANDAGAGSAGSNAAANSGAGGGGGGNGSSTAGAGGNGGSGKLIVMWVE